MIKFRVVKSPLKEDTESKPRSGSVSRRQLLKAAPLGGLALLLRGGELVLPPVGGGEPSETPYLSGPLDPISDEGAMPRGVHALHKIRDFDRTYEDDFRLEESQLRLLEKTADRIERAMRFVGHGHFNLVSFDELLRYAHRFAEIGSFTRAETDLMEELFYADAAIYGFLGKKVLGRLTASFDPREVKKIPATGHYLLRGEPLAKYERIRRDLGDGVFLTSGVRGVVKQYQLFLSKAVRTRGNLSQASRSLAPPGYSYHAIGDFDVGRVGLGKKNFTADFARTAEYRRLIDLGYVAIRYTETNPFGVRHEPWHIKIA